LISTDSVTFWRDGPWAQAATGKVPRIAAAIAKRFNMQFLRKFFGL
jgi:hypothetical protein